jgi:CheY-like chemotaxis protein
MSSDVRERIFDPFFTTKGPRKGSGMGLAVVHGIIKGCGGAITLESEVGRGSTFDVFIPRIEVGPERESTPSGIVSRGKERILVIEDDEIQLRSMAEMLKRLGYSVTAHSDGPEALDDFQRNPRGFDLVVTDQAMPWMSGIELAERMLMLRPDLPVILCTGYTDEVDEERARAVGVRGVVNKPFTLADVSAAIRQALKRGG